MLNITHYQRNANQNHHEVPFHTRVRMAAVHGVAKNRTRLRDFTFTFHFHALEKEMTTHSSVLAWRIPLIGSFIFMELSCRSCLYIFEISCLSVASFAIIFSHSEACLFMFIVSFVVQKLLSLIRSHLFIFVFISNILGGGS